MAPLAKVADSHDVMCAAVLLDDDTRSEEERELAKRLRTLALNMRQQENRGDHEVVRLFASIYGLDPAVIAGPTRAAKVVLARHLCMYIMREHYGLGLREIGEWFSNRDHSTVLHALSRAETMIAERPLCRAMVDDIVKQLNRTNNALR